VCLLPSQLTDETSIVEFVFFLRKDFSFITFCRKNVETLFKQNSALGSQVYELSSGKRLNEDP
jgi:hypothetical protein